MTDSLLTIPVRRAAREFVERHVGPSDLIAVLSTSGRNVLTQDFTTDKTRALATIDRFMGSGCSMRETLFALDFLGSLASHLGGVRGHRVSVVWISEGVGVDIGPEGDFGTSGVGIADMMAGLGSSALHEPVPLAAPLTTRASPDAAAALRDFDEKDYAAPAFLEQLVPGAIKITIGEGEKKTQDIRLRI